MSIHPWPLDDLHLQRPTDASQEYLPSVSRQFWLCQVIRVFPRSHGDQLSKRWGRLNVTVLGGIREIHQASPQPTKPTPTIRARTASRPFCEHFSIQQVYQSLWTPF